MNHYQQIWWQQAKSDHKIFMLLREAGVPECHLLHQMQMVTEKIAKAYLWRSGSAPPKNHAGFVHFLRRLGQVRQYERVRIAGLFGFGRFNDFQNWLRQVLPLAYELQNVAPALANDGPNPEYPWPHLQPEFCPTSFSFPIWAKLVSSQGRPVMNFVRVSVDRFPEFADV